MKDTYNCIIIGGGIAGLYLLDKFTNELGIKDICLLERTPNLGGKIKTLYNSKGNPILEKGPWRINNSHSKILGLINKLGLEIEQNSSSKKTALNYNYDICKKKNIRLTKKFSKESGYSYKDSLTKKKNKCFANKIDSFSKLPLVMDSTSKPYDANMAYSGKYYIVKKGLNSICKNLEEKVKNFIKLNCNVIDVSFNGEKYKINYLFRDKNNYTNKIIYCKNIFLCLPPSYTEKWSIIQENLLPLIYSVDTLPLHHIYGFCKNLDNLNNNQFYINTNSELSQIISGDFSNNWFQVSYTSGENARYWNRIKLQQPYLFKKLLQSSLKKNNINLVVSKIKSYYWENAIHYWIPNYKIDVNKSSNESTYPHPINLPNLFWCGEAFSKIQGWIEGALQTTDLVIDKFVSILNDKKIMRPIKLNKNDEFMIIDNRYIDVKKWKKVHPGSYLAIQNHLYEDISLLFRQVKHSKYSWAILNTLQKYWVKNNKFYETIL